MYISAKHLRYTEENNQYSGDITNLMDTLGLSSGDELLHVLNPCNNRCEMVNNIGLTLVIKDPLSTVDFYLDKDVTDILGNIIGWILSPVKEQTRHLPNLEGSSILLVY